MKTLKQDGSTSLTRQLSIDILNDISSGVYKPGDKLPSESEMMQTYKVSRVTIRNAIARLVNDGFLLKHQGKGTFVAMPQYHREFNGDGSFTQAIAAQGKTPSTQIISIEKMEADQAIAKHLGVSVQTTVIRLMRLRLIDGVPAILELDYFRDDFGFLFENNLQDVSLMDLIRQNKGVEAYAFVDEFEAVSAGDFAVFLGCAKNHPLLKQSQILLDEFTQIIYYNEQYIDNQCYPGVKRITTR
ncbi:MAG: GntR family transcriptional regulator [Erysipelotrichaceae bacterium]|jgi:GntR family transcriptional regulator|nr:GntR family transcriptional regulator [Erysipelotrichaceae bacterium]